MFVGVDFGAQRLVAAAIDETGRRCVEAADSVHLSRQHAVVGPLGPIASTAHHPHQLATGIKPQLGEAQFGYVVDDRSWRPESLAAILLRSALQAVSQGRPHTRLAVMVSASFDCVQRRALRAAAEIAGIEHVVFVSDVAAATAAWIVDEPGVTARALICDLGASTCDLAVVNRQGSQARVERMQGETWGSAGWDDLVSEALAEVIEREVGESPLGPLTEKAWRRSMAPLAARLRHELDSREMASWESRLNDQIPRGWLFAHQLEAMVAPTVDWLEGQLRHVLNDQPVDRVILTGAGSRMPYVRQRIEQVCGRTAEDRSAPTLNALGAARLAQQWSQPSGDQVGREKPREKHATAAGGTLQVTDVAPASLGVQTIDRRSKKAVNKIVLDAGTPLPCHRVLKLGKIGDVQVNVKLLQGEILAAEDNRLLGECHLTREMCGEHPVQLRLGYDRCGELDVHLQLPDQALPVEVVSEERLSEEKCRELSRTLPRQVKQLGC